MATFAHTWTYPDNQQTRVRDGIAYGLGYQDTVMDPETHQQVSNPETKVNFIHRRLNELFIDFVKSYETRKDAKAAIVAAEASVNSIGITGS